MMTNEGKKLLMLHFSIPSCFTFKIITTIYQPNTRKSETETSADLVPQIHTLSGFPNLIRRINTKGGNGVLVLGS